MDIFNEEKVKSQERQILDLKYENSRLRSELAELKVKFEEASRLEESMPKDCTKGPWCKACEFAKVYFHIEHYGMGSWNTVPYYMCGKGESCSNFVKKED